MMIIILIILFISDCGFVLCFRQACTFLNHALLRSCEICQTTRREGGTASLFAARAEGPWSAGSPEACRGQPWDEIGQRLHICEKRDYRFLSLEALSLVALPRALTECLSPATARCSSSGGTDQAASLTSTKATDGTGDTATVSVEDAAFPRPFPRMDGARLASQLTVLFLNDNDIATFPEELSQLSQLRELHMHYNKLVTLPPSIGSFLHLEKLFLSHNSLVTLPPEIGRLSSLQVQFCIWLACGTLQLDDVRPYTKHSLNRRCRFSIIT